MNDTPKYDGERATHAEDTVAAHFARTDKLKDTAAKYGFESMLGAACCYVLAGSPVFPLHTPLTYGPKTGEGRATCSCRSTGCTAQGKHPRTANGLKNATEDPDQIIEWWTKWPEANIGLATGVTFDVLDLDGDTAWDLYGLSTMAGEWANTQKVITGRGRHIYVFATGHGNKASMIASGSGIDYRGRGGYVVAPPSVHYLTGARYAWATIEGGIDEHGKAAWWAGPDVFTNMSQPAPDSLHYLLEHGRPHPMSLLGQMGDQRAEETLFAPGQHSSTRTDSPTRRDDDLVGLVIPDLSDHKAGSTRYGLRGLEIQVAKMRAATVGERNHTIFAAAVELARLVAGEELDRETAWSMIYTEGRSTMAGDFDAARTVQERAETEKALIESIKSGWMNGLRRPRKAPEATHTSRKRSRAGNRGRSAA